MPVLSTVLFTKAWGQYFGSSLYHKTKYDGLFEQSLDPKDILQILFYTGMPYVLMGFMFDAFSRSFEWDQPALMEENFETQEQDDLKWKQSMAFRITLGVLFLAIVIYGIKAFKIG